MIESKNDTRTNPKGERRAEPDFLKGIRRRRSYNYIIIFAVIRIGL